MKPRKWLCWGAALLAAALLPIAGCSKNSGEEAGDEAVTAEVTLTKVTRENIQQFASVSGNVVALPNQDVKLSALVAGRITSLNVAEGDRVRSGELLAELDPNTYQQQLQQSQAAAAQAEATLKNAQLSVARNRTLFARGIAARKDLEDAETQLSIAQAAAQQAEASENLAKLQVSRTKIVSPLTGVVAKRFASVGEQVDGTGTQPIVEVANISQVELSGSLPAAYLAVVHLGEKIPVTSEAIPGQTFPGRVVAISPAVDPSTNVGNIRIRIDNPRGVLKLGMYLNAQVPLETHANALTLPLAAIYRDEAGKTEVYEVSGDTAKAADVTLGIESGGRAEILSGVKAGDTVVLNGGYGLGDTTKIKVKS